MAAIIAAPYGRQQPPWPAQPWIGLAVGRPLPLPTKPPPSQRQQSPQGCGNSGNSAVTDAIKALVSTGNPHQ